VLLNELMMLEEEEYEVYNVPIINESALQASQHKNALFRSYHEKHQNTTFAREFYGFTDIIFAARRKLLRSTCRRANTSLHVLRISFILTFRTWNTKYLKFLESSTTVPLSASVPVTVL
jgi:hypothetical protein